MQAVEELTGRNVETVLSATREEHDVSTLVFTLEAPEDAALRETEEGATRERKQMRKRAGELRDESRLLREHYHARREALDEPEPD